METDGVCGPSADVASRFGGTVGFEGVAFAAGWRLPPPVAALAATNDPGSRKRCRLSC